MNPKDVEEAAEAVRKAVYEAAHKQLTKFASRSIVFAGFPKCAERIAEMAKNEVLAMKDRKMRLGPGEEGFKVE